MPDDRLDTIFRRDLDRLPTLAEHELVPVRHRPRRSAWGAPPIAGAAATAVVIVALALIPALGVPREDRPATTPDPAPSPAPRRVVERIPLPPGARVEAPSPDGRLLLVMPPHATGEVAIYDLGGRVLGAVKAPPIAAVLGWLPDSSGFLFKTWSPGAPRAQAHDLSVLELDGRLRTIANEIGPIGPSGVAVSGDGRWIAVVSCCGTPTLRAVARDGSSSRPLGALAANDQIIGWDAQDRVVVTYGEGRYFDGVRAIGLDGRVAYTVPFRLPDGGRAGLIETLGSRSPDRRALVIRPFWLVSNSASRSVQLVLVDGRLREIPADLAGDDMRIDTWLPLGDGVVLGRRWGLLTRYNLLDGTMAELDVPAERQWPSAVSDGILYMGAPQTPGAVRLLEIGRDREFRTVATGLAQADLVGALADGRFVIRSGEGFYILDGRTALATVR